MILMNISLNKAVNKMDIGSHKHDKTVTLIVI